MHQNAQKNDNKNAHKNQGFFTSVAEVLAQRNSFICSEIYQNSLLPIAQTDFGGRQHNSILVEDNDSKHRSKISVE